MTNSNKFWKAIVWGALAGGAISLLDKQTRTAMKENCTKAAKSVTYVIKNPEEITNQVKERAAKFKEVIEEITDDITYISSKVEELKDTTPQVVKMVKDTKDTFAKDKDDIELE